MDMRHFYFSLSCVLILVCISSSSKILVKCPKLLEKLNQRRSTKDSSQLPLYHNVPQEEIMVSKEIPPFNTDMYIESTDGISDPALQREIESILKLPNPVKDFHMPISTDTSFAPSLPPQFKLIPEGKLGKSKIINKLYKYITWEEAHQRSVSKVAKVASRISGDIASLMVAEKFRKMGRFAGDITRILVSDLTIKGLDGFQAMLGIKL